jgi:ATP adenylyltransferase
LSSADSTAEPSTAFGGSPDGFERLWTPHRLVYIQNGQQPEDCPFCAAPSKSDEDSLIVYRGEHAFALLNLYPYNSGHLLVCPYRHIANYDEANAAEMLEIGEITQTAMRVLRQTSGSHGFNIGMNQGEVAGAGIAAHLHQHIVPRWRHDANFFPIIAETKALPLLLGQVRETIANAWR